MCKPDPHISIQGMLGMLCYSKLFQVGQFESAFKRPRQSHQWQLTPGMIFLSCQHLWATSLKVQHPSQHTSARLSTPDCETNSTMKTKLRNHCQQKMEHTKGVLPGHNALHWELIVKMNEILPPQKLVHSLCDWSPSPSIILSLASLGGRCILHQIGSVRPCGLLDIAISADRGTAASFILSKNRIRVCIGARL